MPRRRAALGIVAAAVLAAAGLPAPAKPLAMPAEPPVLAGPARAVVEYSGPGGQLSGPFAEFAAYALQRAAPPAEQDAPRASALIDPQSLGSVPRRATCASQPPAVALDLDPQDKAFDLANPPLPAQGLGPALAALRDAGITVMWLSGLPVSEAQRLYTVLRATELDPAGTDRLLLVRKAGERKQARLQAAARDWCVVAIAADRRADFDEVFDYLREPEGWVAQALEKNIGAGWFLTPLPIR